MTSSSGSCPPTVLLVDDTPANLVALRAVLNPLGVHTVEARSGAEALEHLKREPFVVVLLDVQMPVMDGFETARRMRELPNGREVPIVFLTAIHRDEQYAKRGYASGAADYITKPFDADVLRARVRAFVDLYRQREEANRAKVEERTRERDEALRRLEAFERISTAALETDDLDAFLHTLVAVFMSAADSADTVCILLRQGDELVTRACIGLDDDVEARIRVHVDTGFTGKIAATGRPMLLVGDDINRTVLSSVLRARGLKAIYGVPLVHDGEVTGVAYIGTTAMAGFTESEKRLVQALAYRAAWVSSRQHARERLFEVLAAAPVAISVWRAFHGTCEFANEAYRKQQGRCGPTARGGTLQAPTPEVLELFARVIGEGETLSFDEYPMTDDWDGSGVREERFFRFCLHPLRDALGRPESVLWVSIDLTDQVRARQVVEAAHRETEIASRAKDDFLATVSHELRTPLNAILGWTASARRGAVTDLDRALGIVERNARSQARLIEDVLDLSRIVSGKLRLEIVPTDVTRAVLGAVEAVRPAAEAKGVALEVSTDEQLGFVAADPDRLQQVVWNLLSNAVKFTPAAGRVHVSTVKRADKIVLRVVDSGQGISPDFLPYVFEPFRQADASTTRRHGGLGLGLAIVKQLVHAHGGTIRAESQGPGRGATFALELPARPSPVFEGESQGAAVWDESTRLDQLRVLVVDDEEDARELVGELLESQGAIIAVAQSAQEALDKMPTFHPDVLVSDVAMPEVDGYSLIERVRGLSAERGGSVPAIALTAYTRSEDRDRAIRAGFQVRVAKPVDPSRLVSSVAEVSRSP